MREANPIGADRYFHAEANCEAAQRGTAGATTARTISDVRETTDQMKRDAPQGRSAGELRRTRGRHIESEWKLRQLGVEVPSERPRFEGRLSTRAKVGLVLLFALVALGVRLIVFTPGPVDRCLDQGGSWNYSLEVCERE